MMMVTEMANNQNKMFLTSFISIKQRVSINYSIRSASSRNCWRCKSQESLSSPSSAETDGGSNCNISVSTVSAIIDGMESCIGNGTASGGRNSAV